MAAPATKATKATRATKAIPDGYRTVTTYLVLKDAAKAIEFYGRAFGAVELFRFPGPGGEGVMHAEIKIGDSILMLSDENPQYGTKSPLALGGTPVSTHLYVEDVDAAFKKATAAGAKTIAPPSDMFWGDRFGKVLDPFGHEWSLATHVEDVSPEEIGARAAKLFGR